MKTNYNRDVLFVYLYIDDFIFICNSLFIIKDFKYSTKEFDITDLGLTTYFLGIKVIQNSEGILISYEHYKNEIKVIRQRLL